MSSFEKITKHIQQSEPQLNTISNANKTRAPHYGLAVTLIAKSGKQEHVAAVLNNALNVIARESGTLTWYAYRITDTKFGIFDTFHTQEARQNHLNGDLAKTLEQITSELLESEPVIQKLSILASKI